MMNTRYIPAPFTDWFAGQGWQVRAHQLEMVAAARAGEDALLIAPTGSGKTLAGFLPSLIDLYEHPRDGLHTIYISPLKALANDIARNLERPLAEMGLDIKAETRTGDTASADRQRQRRNPPHILLTTPESLSLLLSFADSRRMLGGLKTIIIDEIHAFAPSKRGMMLSLALARLARIAPDARRVGLSATIKDEDAHARWLTAGALDRLRLVRGEAGAAPDIRLVIPYGRTRECAHPG